MSIRLLHTKDLTFKEFIGSKIPRYAIISHRWTDVEVSYEDFSRDREAFLRGDIHNHGWTKIYQASKIADIRGYEWFWIDTCCIDKKSSAELSEAINSMFNWYARSEECYVFLRDVDETELDHDGQEACSTNFRPLAEGWQYARFDENEFRRSEWFTRAWTLQELLAPRKVFFFNAGFALIASKHGCDDLISEITSIPTQYLSLGASHDPSSWRRRLLEPTVAERMRWASLRQATRTEDLSYSLLGLFGVNLPLLYGEEERAFYRLQTEIIRKTDDESIFAWSGADPTWTGFLAPHLRVFREEGLTRVRDVPRQHYEVTNKGLRILLPLPTKGLDITCEVPIRLNCRKSTADKFSVYIRTLIWPEQKHKAGSKSVPYYFGGRVGLAYILPMAEVNPRLEIPTYFATGWQ